MDQPMHRTKPGGGPLKLLVVLPFLLLSACNAIPMNFEEWKAEQAKRKAYKEAGVAYKSPQQIRAEAIATRKAVGDVIFDGTKR